MKIEISPGRIGTLVLLPCLVAACSDGTTTVNSPPRPARVDIVANSAAFTDTAWNTLVAEVTVRASRVDSVDGPVRRPEVPLTYVLERHRKGDDWDTKIRIPHQPWMPGNSGGANIASMSFGADGGMVAEDESGAPIDVQAPNPALVRPRSATPPSPRFAEILGKGASTRPARKAPRVKGSAWVQAYVTDRVHGRQQRDRIRASMGARRGAKGSVEWYEKRSGTDTRRVFVDSGNGLVRSVELERNGKRIRTTAYTYVEQPDGMLVRSGIHTEMAPVEGHSGGTVDVQFTGLRLERRSNP